MHQRTMGSYAPPTASTTNFASQGGCRVRDHLDNTRRKIRPLAKPGLDVFSSLWSRPGSRFAHPYMARIGPLRLLLYCRQLGIRQVPHDEVRFQKRKRPAISEPPLWNPNYSRPQNPLGIRRGTS
jgi:hypothetical protein